MQHLDTQVITIQEAMSRYGPVFQRGSKSLAIVKWILGRNGLAFTTEEIRRDLRLGRKSSVAGQVISELERGVKHGQAKHSTFTPWQFEKIAVDGTHGAKMYALKTIGGQPLPIIDGYQIPAAEDLRWTRPSRRTPRQGTPTRPAEKPAEEVGATLSLGETLRVVGIELDDGDAMWFKLRADNGTEIRVKGEASE